jgi:hypothetical protein
MPFRPGRLLIHRAETGIAAEEVADLVGCQEDQNIPMEPATASDWKTKSGSAHT